MDPLQKRAEDAEQAQDFATALGLWRTLAAKYSSDESFLVRYGSVARKLGEWGESEKAFTQALRLSPDSSLIMENLGILWAEREDKDQTESFRIAKQWFSSALSRERHARLLTELGATEIALNNVAAGRVAFEEAVALDADYEEALYNLAILEERGNPERAIDLLERAIRIDPAYAIAHQTLGRLYQRSKDLLRAHYHFRRCLEIDPSDYWSHIYLANLLAVQGKSDEAEQTYRFATRLHPEISGGLELYANFLESTGKPDEAAKVRSKLPGAT
jgi:Tfp pilus assembly protein PilF